MMIRSLGLVTNFRFTCLMTQDRRNDAMSATHNNILQHCFSGNVYLRVSSGSASSPGSRREGSLVEAGAIGKQLWPRKEILVRRIHIHICVRESNFLIFGSVLNRIPREIMFSVQNFRSILFPPQHIVLRSLLKCSLRGWGLELGWSHRTRRQRGCGGKVDPALEYEKLEVTQQNIESNVFRVKYEETGSSF